MPRGPSRGILLAPRQHQRRQQFLSAENRGTSSPGRHHAICTNPLPFPLRFPRSLSNPLTVLDPSFPNATTIRRRHHKGRRPPTRCQCSRTRPSRSPCRPARAISPAFRTSSTSGRATDPARLPLTSRRRSPMGCRSPGGWWLAGAARNCDNLGLPFHR